MTQAMAITYLPVYMPFLTIKGPPIWFSVRVYVCVCVGGGSLGVFLKIFFFLPIESLPFFHSLRDTIFFSGQSKNIFFLTAYVLKMSSFRSIRSCISWTKYTRGVKNTRKSIAISLFVVQTWVLTYNRAMHMQLIDIDDAGVVLCGGRKTSPRTSTIVQFIFHFWSFEISERILRNQKLTIGLDSYSRQFIYLDLIWIYIYISVFLSTAYLKFTKLQYFFSCFRCKVITGSLMRIKYLKVKLRSMAHLLSLECVHCS